MTPHVLVIGGGQNAEHDVSLETAAAIEGALRSRGFEASTITIGRDGRWRQGEEPLGESAADSLVASLPFLARTDVVFPAIHGPLGEDGTLAALCALTHKPVVGSGTRAGAIGMDKWATKLVAEAIGIRTALGRMVRAADVGGIEFETEVVVKPVSAVSSYGVTLARETGQLDEALRTRRATTTRSSSSTSSMAARSTSPSCARPTAAAGRHRRWRSTPTDCSTRPRSTTAQPGSPCPPTSAAQTAPH